jgi:F-type H+-transporting ATPase subunit delta
MSSVARRYAKALFELAKEAGTLEGTGDELARFTVAADQPSVAPVLRSPLLAANRRRSLTQMLARDLGLSDLLTRFVEVLADHQRLAALAGIADYFQKMLDEHVGRVRITVRSAAALDATQEQQVVATFTQLTGKQVLAQVLLDADLLGGVVVEVQDTVYDGSVRTQLNRLARELGGPAAR